MSGCSPMTTPPSFLSGGGEMGQRIREYDWSQSVLGPPDSWPPALTTLASVILGAEQAMFIVWGHQRVLLYNNAYATILGIKHPAALGNDILQVWSEIRADLTPLVNQGRSGLCHPADPGRCTLSLCAADARRSTGGGRCAGVIYSGMGCWPEPCC